MSITKELRYLWRYLFKTSKSEKEIVFYAEYAGSYPVFEGLALELKKKYNKPFCYITSDPTDPVLSVDDPLIRAFYFHLLLPFLMVNMRAKVVLMTMPGLNIHHIKRSINDVCYIYVFHASHSCNATYEFGAFEHYDSVFCTGPHQVAELRKQEELYGFKPKALVEAGYYRIERIYEAYRKYRESHPEPISGKGVVMFAPTWERNFALEKYANPLVRALREAGYDVIVRLHPETPRRFPEWVSAFEAEHKDDVGFTLEKFAVTDESLFRADVVITDWSGITPEYAFGTERPLLFLEDVPQKINNQRYMELELQPMEEMLRQRMGRILPSDEVPNIAKHVDQIMAERDTYRQQILDMRSKFLYNFGRSSEIGIDHIMKIIKNKGTLLQGSCQVPEKGAFGE